MPFRPPRLRLVETATVPYPSLAARKWFRLEHGATAGRNGEEGERGRGRHEIDGDIYGATISTTKQR